MITQSYPSKKSIATTSYYTPTEHAQSMIRKISPEVYRTRDNQIATLARECPWKVGDIVSPSTEKDIKQYGYVKVIGILSSYKDMAIATEWPVGNNPLILTISICKRPNEILFCTTNWLEEKEKACS